MNIDQLPQKDAAVLQAKQKVAFFHDGRCYRTTVEEILAANRPPVIEEVFAIAKKGDVVFIECDSDLPAEAMDRVSKAFNGLYQQTGVKGVMLGGTMRVARLSKGGQPETRDERLKGAVIDDGTFELSTRLINGFGDFKHNDPDLWKIIYAYRDLVLKKAH